MSLISFIFIAFYSVHVLSEVKARSDFCTVYDPFKVSPDNAKFQIGGPFPLHSEDCVHIRPEIVQELVAVQWALTYWNQNPDNQHYKLAMHAGDTCSRRKETISQTVKFLQSSDFYEPMECSSHSRLTGPTLLGMIVPRDREAAEAVGELLKSDPIPLVSYSTPAVEGLGRNALLFAAGAAPSIAQYFQIVIHVLKHLESNFVTLLVSNQHIDFEHVEILKRTLKHSGIVAKVGYMSDTLTLGEPGIVVCLLSKSEMTLLFSRPSIRNVQKLWITVPLTGEKLTATDFKEILPPASKSIIIVLQETLIEIHEFREYFLHILQNNYQSYSLLSAYMQQVYNCTLTGEPACQDLTEEQMRSMFIQASGVENAILATYTLAALGRKLAEDPRATAVCKVPGLMCTKTIMNALIHLEYQFDDYDPEEFYGFILKFSNADHIALSLSIEGTQIVRDQNHGLSLRKVLEYATGSEVRILDDSNFYWSSEKFPAIPSLCPVHRTECQHCPETIVADPKISSLSAPRNYDLYFIGLFDLHGGANCENQLENFNVLSLPLTFAYTLWTVKEKYPEMNLLPGISLGGFIFDTCSSENRAVKAVLDISEKCILLPYPAENITLSPTNVVGYVAGQKQGSILSELFGKDASQIATPLLTVNQAKRGSFSFFPTYKAQAKTLIEILRNFDWSHIGIILSKECAQCVEAYEVFSSLAGANKICIAEVISPKEYIGGKSKSSPNTKVAIAFTTAEDTAGYFKTIQPESETVFILIGDAHNWQLTDIYRKHPRAEWQQTALGSISLQPKLVVQSEFSEWIESITPNRFPESWYQKFIEEKFRCKMMLSGENPDGRGGKICSGEEILGPAPFGRLTEAGYIALAIESLIFAMDAGYKKFCPASDGICHAFMVNGMKEAVDGMRKISRFDTFEIYNFRIVGDQPIYAKIGNWSGNGNLRFTEPWVWYDKYLKESTAIPTSFCEPPLCTCYSEHDVSLEYLKRKQKFHTPADISQNSDSERSRSGFRVEKMSVKSDLWKSHTWTYIFLALNSILLLLAIGVLTLISVKLYYRVVKGNQSLGICLLFGIILLYGTGYFFILDPSETLCKCRYFMHSLAYSICFGVLIAKATQLRNSETMGFNGYISYWNYWLLLFFIVGVQIALNFQWALVRIPAVLHVIQDDEILIRQCSWSREEFLLSQLYVVILLALVLFQAFMNRNIKRNYKETKWLLYTAAVCTPIWLIWMLIYGLIPAPFRDTVIVMELIICATVILCFMFGPKLYILLSYEPVLIEYPPGYKFGHGAVDNEPHIDFSASRGPSVVEKQIPHSHATVSPSGSSAGSTKSTTLSQSSGTSCSSGEQSPVFQAVVRKKSRSKRIKANAYTGRKDLPSVKRDSCVISPVDSTMTNDVPAPFTLTRVHRKNPLFADPLEIRTVNH